MTKNLRKKRLLENLMLTAISASLSLLGAELLVRMWVPIDTGTSFEHRIPHPVLGWALEPGASYSNRLMETTAHVTYNSKGLRDVERAVDKPERTFRILVLGDSFMEAYSVNLNHAFHRQLETLARQAGREIEVINLGVGGYGTLQEYLIFKEVGQLYAPDLVLLGLYVANDVRNNSLELERMLHGSSMKLESRPFLLPTADRNWRITRVNFEQAKHRYEAVQTQQNTLLSRLVNRSRLVRISKIAIANQSQSPQQSLTVQTESGNALNAQERLDLALHGVNYCDETAEYMRAWRITRHILTRLKRAVELNGSKLIVFSVPAFEEVSPSEIEKARERSPDPDRICLEEAPGYHQLAQMLQELDIEFVDLLPVFRQTMREQDTDLFWRSDRHWNPAGHTLAAQTVVTVLREKELLPRDRSTHF